MTTINVNSPSVIMDVNTSNANSCLKYNLELNALFERKKKTTTLSNENPSILTLPFKTNIKVIFNICDYESSFSVKSKNILKNIEEFEHKDSGWTLVKILNLYLNLNRYQPLKGSAYIPVPRNLQLKKACISVKNRDEYCFKWAILSSVIGDIKNATRTSNYKVNINAKIIILNGTRLDFSGLEFPLPIKDISIFERNNPHISVNVFGYDESKNTIEGPYYRTAKLKEKHITLLFLESGDNAHYVWVKHISRLIKCQITKHNQKLLFCNYCFQHFYDAEKVREHERSCNKQICCLPTERKSSVEFKKYYRKLDMPFVVYANSECIFENIQTRLQKVEVSATTLADKHIPYAFNYFIKCSFDENLNIYREFKGEDSVKLFLEKLVEDIRYLNSKYLKNPVANATLTKKEKDEFSANNKCHICLKDITVGNKVKDFCQLSGKYRGPAHGMCNRDYKLQRYFPVFFHNFSAYDCHLFARELNNIDDGPLTIIPLDKELYMSFSKSICPVKGGEKKVLNIQIRFLDSYRFLPLGLDTLVNKLQEDDFKNLKSFYSNDENQFNLLIKKGVFPTNYLNSLDKLRETKLPKIQDFYNKLNDTHCSLEEYAHAEEVWNKFQCKTLEDYLMLYMKADVLLLADVFENLRKISQTVYGLDPSHFYTGSDFSWDAMLKTTNIKLDLITDLEIFKFIHSGLRGGITQCAQRHTIANNKYLADYNSTEPSKFLIHLEANNLNGWAMSQSLPESGFEWVKDVENFSLDSIPDDSDVGYILEVDLKYPSELHDRDNDLPFCADKKNPPYCQEKKLILDLYNKYNYIIYYKNLKQCLEHGLKLEKIHKILKFKQSPFLKTYISLNNSHHSKAKNPFEKYVFETLNNAVYDKTMETVDTNKVIHVINKWESVGKIRGARAYIAKPEFHSCSIFDENMVAIELNKKHVLYNRPTYLRLAIQELSKLKMYDFHYNYMVRKYHTNAKLNYIDNDFFIYTIDTNDFYSDIIKDIDERFDTSEYDIKNKFKIPLKNANVLGMMKDVYNGRLLKEFVGLRAKMFSLELEEMKKNKKFKADNICQNLSLSDYKNTLYNRQIYRGQMGISKSKLHLIYKALLDEITLSYVDNKRYICFNKENTLAWGHFREDIKIEKSDEDLSDSEEEFFTYIEINDSEEDGEE
ncbi:uncharacterized protein ACRADG_003468 isoform 2-T2 [Cochliomyia hominivorax]